MLSAWRLCSTAMDVLLERRPRVTIQIWLKLGPALPYTNRSSWLGLSEGLLRAKLSMMVELFKDRSRSFSDDSILAKRREIHQQGKFTYGSLLFWLCWVLALLIRWILAGSRRWSKALSNSESQTIEAELGTADVLFSHCFICCDLLACLHDLRRRHCHHHPAGSLYWGSSHSSTVPVVQIIASGLTVCKPIWSQTILGKLHQRLLRTFHKCQPHLQF